MAGYKTRSSWSAPDIQFDAAGKRIRPETPVQSVQFFGNTSIEVCLRGGTDCSYAGPGGLDACGNECALRHPAVAG